MNKYIQFQNKAELRTKQSPITVIQFYIVMNYYPVIIVVFLSFFLTEAQDTLTTPHGSHRLQPSIAIVIGVLGILFLLLLSVLVITKYFYRNISNLLSPRRNIHQFLQSRSKFSGLDRSVIESIPFFKFSSLKGSKEGLECSVCLSMFEENEILRLLPKCEHAFHIDCIDEWLKSHSSCPLCRYKFDRTDFTSFLYTVSLRYDGNLTPMDLMDGPNIELFIKREEDGHGSTGFNIGDSFRKLSKLRSEDRLLIESDKGKRFHKFKHKIIVADSFHKGRWSDLNSSDLTWLNSEMINDTSSRRFNLNSPKHGLSLNGQLEKIKEDMQRKRNFRSGKDKIIHTVSGSRSGDLSPLFSKEGNKKLSSRLLASLEKRSMSDITILTRCKDLRENNKTMESSSLGTDSKDDRIWRLWLPIVRRTLQQFSGREDNFDKSDMRIHTSDV